MLCRGVGARKEGYFGLEKALAMFGVEHGTALLEPLERTASVPLSL